MERTSRGAKLAGGLAAEAMAAALALTTGGAQAQATYEITPRDPQVIYDRTCGYCHGHNVGPILLGRRLPAAVVSAIVRSGNGAMPAFRPTEITDVELAALATWIETASTDTTDHGQ
ncbi:MAG: cytochrome c [Alteraurantiacibacter sp.]